MSDKDPSFRGSINLKPPNAVEHVTEDDYKRFVSEVVKCRNDINYFAENYFTIISQDKGKQLIKLFPKQRDLLQSFMDNDRVVVLSSRQTAKCVKGDSKIKVRNKRTGEIKTLTIGQFHKMVSI